jgi:hypothetical protein
MNTVKEEKIDEIIKFLKTIEGIEDAKNFYLILKRMNCLRLRKNVKNQC